MHGVVPTSYEPGQAKGEVRARTRTRKPGYAYLVLPRASSPVGAREGREGKNVGERRRKKGIERGGRERERKMGLAKSMLRQRRRGRRFQPPRVDPRARAVVIASRYDVMSDELAVRYNKG